ncbi:uncharacterized protein LOC143022627 isoform X1 [Oratosquilla oratoria]|uniref:uncharacterized protein LOC143022627 isoform X1 n=1 Tax=Oratosquilla oratoria TaxID=337810 RepID=UPI003F761583
MNENDSKASCESEPSGVNPLNRDVNKHQNTCYDNDFPGFGKYERKNLSRLLEIEREMSKNRTRWENEIMDLRKEVIGLIDCSTKANHEISDLRKTNLDLTNEIKEMKRDINELKNDNEKKKTNDNNNSENLKQEVNNKLQELTQKIEENLGGDSIQEIKKWKENIENKEIAFKEIVKQQMQDNAKDTIIQVINEKANWVRDTVDRKKCIVVYGLKEKQGLARYMREKEEKETAVEILNEIQRGDRFRHRPRRDLQNWSLY